MAEQGEIERGGEGPQHHQEGKQHGDIAQYAQRQVEGVAHELVDVFGDPLIRVIGLLVGQLQPVVVSLIQPVGHDVLG